VGQVKNFLQKCPGTRLIIKVAAKVVSLDPEPRRQAAFLWGQFDKFCKMIFTNMA